MTSTTPSVPAPRRLVLSKAEYAYLVATTDLEMPPGWRADPRSPIGLAESELAKKRVVRGTGDDAEVHPSVAKNLGILASPTVLLDTVVRIGSHGSHCVHAVAGPLGASLFQLGEGGVELSMFASVHLGRELIRAVPDDSSERGIGDTLGGDDEREPVRGRVPLVALQEVGAARLMRDTDPGVIGAVFDHLDLNAGETKLARQVADRSDGVLRCQITAQRAEGTVSSQITWIHTDAGWAGIQPDPDGARRRMVEITPAARADIGTWAAPAVAGAFS